MQNKWIRFVRGFLVIRMDGDYMERFFNMCRTHSIDLWGIRKENDICVCEAYAADFVKMRPLLKKTGTRASVVKKRGLPFYFPFVKKRIIFFVGVILCLAMLHYMTQYVWAIEYVGNLQVSDDELSDFLEKENIHYGMKKSRLNCDEKEKRLRETFGNVTWTSIYFEGTKLFIEVKENEKSEPIPAKTRGTDIVANEPGTIISIITRNGVPKVKAGDTVERGQILVGGGVPVFDEGQNIVGYQVYDADADINIRTLVEYRDKIRDSYLELIYTGRNDRFVFFEAYGYHVDAMPVFDFFRPKGNKLYEAVTEKHQVVLLDNIYLPLYYGTIDRKECFVRYFTYTEDEMKTKLSENFEKFILNLQKKGVQIVEKNVKMVKDSNGMELSGDLVVVKKTGESAGIQTDVRTDEDAAE